MKKKRIRSEKEKWVGEKEINSKEMQCKEGNKLSPERCTRKNLP